MNNTINYQKEVFYDYDSESNPIDTSINPITLNVINVNNQTIDSIKNKLADRLNDRIFNEMEMVIASESKDLFYYFIANEDISLWCLVRYRVLLKDVDYDIVEGSIIEHHNINSKNNLFIIFQEPSRVYCEQNNTNCILVWNRESIVFDEESDESYLVNNIDDTSSQDSMDSFNLNKSMDKIDRQIHQLVDYKWNDIYFFYKPKIRYN